MRIGYISIAIVLVLSIVLPSCGNGPEVEVRDVVSQMISAENGGTLSVTEEDSSNLAGVELHIPTGALEADQEITIGEVLDGLPPLPEGYISLGHQMSLEPTGLSFATPATLRIVFSEEEWQAWNDIVLADDMLLMMLDEASGSWVELPSRVYEGVLTADIESFSFKDIVCFWKPDDPASDTKIRQRARAWGAPEGWDADTRLWANPMFVDHSRPPFSAADLSFADEIRALLLAEAMWDSIQDGNFYAGASMVKVLAKNIGETAVKELVTRSLGLPGVGLIVTVAKLIVETAIEYVLEDLKPAMSNKQLQIYLGWRGWFFVKEDNEWLWVYKPDVPGVLDTHEDVLSGEYVPRSDQGWLMWYLRPNGSTGSLSYLGSNVPRESVEVLYSLGNELYDLLHRMSEEEWSWELRAYVNPLEADRAWLEYAFSGRNKPPTVSIAAPDSGEVGRLVRLEGEVTDFEQDPIIWQWQQTDGSTVELENHSTLTPQFYPAEPGTYGFTLVAFDLLAENRNSANVTITVLGEQAADVYLTITSTAGGSVTNPGEGTFTRDEGTVVSLEASPANGYQFVSWSGDVATVANVDSASTTITMNGDYSITANFEEIPPDQYSLTISSTSGGSVTTPGEGAFAYDEGTVVNLVASQSTGYQFMSWTGDIGTIGNVNAASTTVTVNGDYSITAQFEEVGQDEVYFPDPNLEAAIRSAIHKPEGPIYRSDLNGLTNLSAEYRNIFDLTGLEYCTSLTELNLQVNEISDISPLANLASLTVVWLSHNDISDILPLAGLTSLTELNLQVNEISDISPLADLTSLTHLYLGTNQISDISPVANLASLIDLRFDHNQISDISPLADLTSLTHLYLTFNQISDISSVANLTSLQHLYFYGNQISDISPLANLTNLPHLGLQDNQISDISTLANLTKLRSLVLWGNQISDISPLANLTSLTHLYLDQNQISDISPLANLTNPRRLLLNGNRISDIGPLVDNLGLGEGDDVELQDNPLSEDSISVYIPQLEARGVDVNY